MIRNYKSVLPVLVFLGITIWLACCGGNTPDAVFNRGVRAYQESDPIGASLYFEDFIKKFPEDENITAAYEMLARCYYDLRDFANARKVFQEMKQKFTDPNIQVLSDFEIGSTYFYEGFFDKSITHFQEIAGATTNPHIQVRAYSYLASIYAKQTQAATAEEYYDKILQIAGSEVTDPTAALEYKLMALSGTAEVMKASGEFEQAREVYKKEMDVVNSATGIVGLEADRQNALINWAHTWASAGDFISSATIYDQLQTNPAITEEVKPQLIVWKIKSLESLFKKDGNPPYTPEEVNVLVHENQRLVKDYSETDYGIQARLAIAMLVRDTTPEEAQENFNEAVDMLEKAIREPSTPERPLVALFQLADAYIRYNKFDQAKQTIERIRQNYSQVPNAMQRAAGMLQYIEKTEQDRAKKAAAGPEVPTPLSGAPAELPAVPPGGAAEGQPVAPSPDTAPPADVPAADSAVASPTNG